MSAEYRRTLRDELLTWDTDEAEFIVERGVIEPDRTFSTAAMEQLHDQLLVFVATRLERRWAATGEPPTALRVEIKVAVG